MKILNKIFIKKNIEQVFIPLGLLFMWLILTLLYIFNYNLSLSVISYSHDKSNFKEFSTKRIYAGDKIKGEFSAKENYLGIVTVNFTTFKQVAYADEDTLIFRIKEKNAKKWYYENFYRSGLIYELSLFPFGFPKIETSKGKTYDFEIESEAGNNLNAVALNNWEPVLISRYQIPKNELLQSKTSLLMFFERKILVAFGNRDVLFFSFVYFLPFLFYLILFVTPFKKYFLPATIKVKNRIECFMDGVIILREILYILRFLRKMFDKHLDTILLSVVLINIFLIPVLNDIALIVVATLWLFTAKIYNHTSKDSFMIGIFLLALCPLILFLNLENVAEKSSVWAYMFFLAGTIQIFKEMKNTRISQIRLQG